MFGLAPHRLRIVRWNYSLPKGKAESWNFASPCTQLICIFKKLEYLWNEKAISENEKQESYSTVSTCLCFKMA